MSLNIKDPLVFYAPKGDESACSICHETECHETEENKVIAHPVKVSNEDIVFHTAHKSCFLKWLRTNENCFICRQPVDPSGIYSFTERISMVVHRNFDILQAFAGFFISSVTFMSAIFSLYKEDVNTLQEGWTCIPFFIIASGFLIKKMFPRVIRDHTIRPEVNEGFLHAASWLVSSPLLLWVYCFRTTFSSFYSSFGLDMPFLKILGTTLAVGEVTSFFFRIALNKLASCF